MRICIAMCRRGSPATRDFLHHPSGPRCRRGNNFYQSYYCYYYTSIIKYSYTCTHIYVRSIYVCMSMSSFTLQPWPAEIYDHNGVAHNITLEPGEMALYESHTTLHGRPFPLNGTFFANLFVHFKPVEYDDLLETERESGVIAGFTDNDRGGHESDNHDDETLERHRRAITREEAAKLGKTLHNNKADGRTQLHVACAEGSLDEVEKLLKNSNTDMLNVADVHGWLPIHEAVRTGEVDLVKYLVDLGADISAITVNGGTPLWWAQRLLKLAEMGRPESVGTVEGLTQVRNYLTDIGAPDEGNEAAAL